MTETAPDSERTKELMASTSNPPTEDEVVAIVASRIQDQVDFDLINELMERMTEQELDEGKAILAKASPEPWFNGSDFSHFGAPEVTDRKTFAYYIATDADAKFVAWARSAIPRMFKHIEDLTQWEREGRKNFHDMMLERNVALKRTMEIAKERDDLKAWIVKLNELINRNEKMSK